MSSVHVYITVLNIKGLIIFTEILFTTCSDSDKNTTSSDSIRVPVSTNAANEQMYVN